MRFLAARQGRQAAVWRLMPDMNDKAPSHAPRARILLLDLGREMRGGQRQVFYLARALVASSDFLPLLACPAGSPLMEEAKAAGIPTLELSGSFNWDAVGFLRLFRFLRAEPLPSIIHTHDAKAATFGAALAGACPGTLLMHTRRVSYPVRSGKRGAKYRDAHAIAAVSSEIRDVLVAGGVAPAKIRIIHSGIDASRYSRKRERNDGRFIFGSVGALTEQKGHETLIRALPVFSRLTGMLDWEVRILGQGELFEHLLTVAEDLGVAKKLAMLGWQDSAALLPDMDVLLVPSVDGEGSSGVIKEGWTVGLPVIASNLPSNMELIRPGENGLSFPCGNSDALAEQMAVLVRNPDLQRKLVAGGDISVQEVTADRMCASYMEMYRDLLVPRPVKTVS